MVERTRLAALCAAALVCGCGAGGDAGPAFPDPAPAAPSAPTPPGPPTQSCAPSEGSVAATGGAFAVGGTIAGWADPSFIAMPVPNPYGEAYGRYQTILVYGPDLAASSALSGFVEAGDSYWCHDSKAYNGSDYGVDGGWTSDSFVYLHFTVDSPSSTVSGSIRNAKTSQGLGGTSLPGAAADYTFSQPARISDIAGLWKLNSTGGVGIDVHIGNDGQMTVAENGFVFGARLVPSPDGVNLFGFGGGVGMAYPLTTGERQLLLVWYQDGGMGYIPRVALGRR
jgi:hypothetical protein